MNCPSATIKDVPIFVINKFKSIYILFKFLPQQLFLPKDYEFFLKDSRLSMKNTELDRIDVICNTQCSIGQLELNIFESNYHAIKI